MRVRVRACACACSNFRAKIILKNFQKDVDGQKKFLYSSGYGSKGSNQGVGRWKSSKSVFGVWARHA